MTLRQAMARRLRRNYFWLFLILLLAWLLKTTTTMLQPKAGTGEFLRSTNQVFANAAIGLLPGWIVLIVILAFYGWMTFIMYTHRESTGELAYGEVHV